ncbi:hypothetical protein SKAU_G00288060 [Synaphobranchus kaupii]|uniref:Uncharacterized protein n=1 Tax=Synaphobranchus kaupii TaxID=118154 RepID=A0A9Q1ET91_SYNKA|nr:hypothetical protein SKAU_G00288060 [Synaphobranchus kaupii]
MPLVFTPSTQCAATGTVVNSEGTVKELFAVILTLHKRETEDLALPVCNGARRLELWRGRQGYRPPGHPGGHSRLHPPIEVTKRSGHDRNICPHTLPPQDWVTPTLPHLCCPPSTPPPHPTAPADSSKQTLVPKSTLYRDPAMMGPPVSRGGVRETPVVPLHGRGPPATLAETVPQKSAADSAALLPAECPVPAVQRHRGGRATRSVPPPILIPALISTQTSM